MMRTFKVHLTDPVGKEAAEPLTLIVNQKLPRICDYESLMQDDAELIVKELHRHLPAGTWARLVNQVALTWARDQCGYQAIQVPMEETY